MSGASGIPYKSVKNQLAHTDWNAVPAWADQMVSQIALLLGQISSINGSLSQTSQQTTALSTQVAQLQTSVTNLTASVSTLQTNQTSILNRITVLEKATPPPATSGAPTGLNSTAITTTTIAMSLSPPVGGVAPTGYQWRIATPQGSGNWVNGALTTGTTTTFTGLTPGAGYDIDAISQSAAGPGGVSLTYSTSTSTGTSPPAVTVPGAPTGLTTTATTPNSLSVSAIPPTTGSPPTSYHWEYITPP